MHADMMFFPNIISLWRKILIFYYDLSHPQSLGNLYRISHTVWRLLQDLVDPMCRLRSTEYHLLPKEYDISYHESHGMRNLWYKIKGKISVAKEFRCNVINKLKMVGSKQVQSSCKYQFHMNAARRLIAVICLLNKILAWT